MTSKGSNKAKGPKAPTRRQIAERERAERERKEQRRVRLITAGVLAAVLVVIGGVVAISSGGGGGDVPDRVVNAASTGATPPGLVDGAIVIGSGPVRVTLYEDLQCPACKAFETMTGGTVRELVDENAITLERRPLAFLDRASTTAYSTRSLNAVGCVLNAKADVASPYIDALFANQPEEGGPGLSDERLNELAVAAGSPDVSTCLADLTYKGWTERQTAASDDAGVTQTPTVLVNGKALEDLSPNGLRAAVQAAV